MIWFGFYSLEKTLQCDVKGIVTALHHIPVGDIWTVDEIKRMEVASSIIRDLLFHLEDKYIKPGISTLELDKIATTFTGVGAVCFSKDGQWYSASENLINGSVPITAIYICEKEAGSCTKDGGINTVEYLYIVSWSRFGNIKLEKYNFDRNEWINQ